MPAGPDLQCAYSSPRVVAGSSIESWSDAFDAVVARAFAALVRPLRVFVVVEIREEIGHFGKLVPGPVYQIEMFDVLVGGVVVDEVARVGDEERSPVD